MGNILRNAVVVAVIDLLTYICASSIHKYVVTGRYNKDGWKNLYWAILSGAGLLLVLFLSL